MSWAKNKYTKNKAFHHLLFEELNKKDFSIWTFFHILLFFYVVCVFLLSLCFQHINPAFYTVPYVTSNAWKTYMQMSWTSSRYEAIWVHIKDTTYPLSNTVFLCRCIPVWNMRVKRSWETVYLRFLFAVEHFVTRNYKQGRFIERFSKAFERWGIL